MSPQVAAILVLVFMIVPALSMNMRALLVASTQDIRRDVLFHQFLIKNDFPGRPGTRPGGADPARLVVREPAA